MRVQYNLSCIKAIMGDFRVAREVWDLNFPQLFPYDFLEAHYNGFVPILSYVNEAD